MALSPACGRARPFFGIFGTCFLATCCLPATRVRCCSALWPAATVGVTSPAPGVATAIAASAITSLRIRRSSTEPARTASAGTSPLDELVQALATARALLRHLGRVRSRGSRRSAVSGHARLGLCGSSEHHTSPELSHGVRIGAGPPGSFSTSTSEQHLHISATNMRSHHRVSPRAGVAR